MTQSARRLVPGLPDGLRALVLARAQGVPLYAVETVRMLLDRGLLAPGRPGVPADGEIQTLEVPESLHALAAARLDGLPRRGAPAGAGGVRARQSFTKQALAALAGGRGRAGSAPRGPRPQGGALAAGGPACPERGQYGFLQDLLRQVAYDTLSRRDRKARHLAAVDALEQSFEGAEQEVPEVIAAHLLAAADAGPDDSNTPEIRLRARAALVHAGERAAALAAPEEAQRYFDQAADLAGDEAQVRAHLLQRAGRLAFQAGSTSEARQRIEQAIELYRQLEDAHAAALAGVALADVDVSDGRLDEAKARFEAALSTLEEAGPTPELAATIASLGRMEALRGDPDAPATLERALRLAETLGLEEVLVQALISRGLVLTHEGRLVESRLLLEGALARSRAAGLYEWRALNNLIVLAERCELFQECLELSAQQEAVARQRGDRENLIAARLGQVGILFELGRWEEALARVAEIDQLQASRHALSGAVDVALVHCERGRLDVAEAVVGAYDWLRGAEQADLAASFGGIEARVLRAQGRPSDALTAAERGLAHRAELGMTNGPVKRCLVQVIEAALDLDDLTKAAELLASVEDLQPGELTPSLEGHRARLRARLDIRRGEHDRVDLDFSTAEVALGGQGFVLRRRRRPVRARRMARRAGTGVGCRAAARPGARDLRAARGESLARAPRLSTGRRGQRDPRVEVVTVPAQMTADRLRRMAGWS